MSNSTLPLGNDSNLSSPDNSNLNNSQITSIAAIKIEHSKKSKKEIKAYSKIRFDLPKCTFSLLYQMQLANQEGQRLEGDLILFDSLKQNEHGEVRGILEVWNHYKKISSIIFDAKNKIVQVKVEPKTLQTMPFASMEQRLKSLNSKEAYKLGNMITLYGNGIEKIRSELQNIVAHPSKSNKEYILYQKKVNETFQNHENFQTIAFKFKFNTISKDFEVFEILFNNAYSNTVYKNVDEFISYLQQYGFPDSHVPDENYFEFYAKVLKNTFFVERK